MRNLLVAAFLVLTVGACKKNVDTEVIGTVISQGGAEPGYYLVEITNPSSSKYSFICKDNGTLPPIPVISCYTHIFITNLPKHLQLAGIRIRFSSYKDKGANLIFSSNVVPHDVEVYDASVAP